MEYEEIAPALQDYKIENNGIWLSWEDLWKIDAVACRNGMKAMKASNNGDEVAKMLFQNFIGQRMLILEITELFKRREAK